MTADTPSREKDFYIDVFISAILKGFPYLRGIAVYVRADGP